MTETYSISSTWKLVVAIVICETTGIVSGLLTNTKNNLWFDSIQKPSWNPPGYLFGPVWTILFFLMGISLWIVWKSNSSPYQKFNACLFFATQLLFNFWWTIIFFKFQSPIWAFAEIMVLWLLILLTIFKFAQISKTASWLLVPYISWVTFAALLNYNLWILNGL